MKTIFLQITVLSSLVIFLASSFKSAIIEYVPIKYRIVSQGDYAPYPQKQLVVSYNKYFNEGYFSSDFIKQNHLDTINYKKSTLIEILLGEMPAKGYVIKIDKIEENDDSLKVYYLVNKPNDSMGNKTSRPYIFVQIHKTKKKPVFIENGEEVKMGSNSLYIDKK